MGRTNAGGMVDYQANPFSLQRGQIQVHLIGSGLERSDCFSFARLRLAGNGEYTKGNKKEFCQESHRGKQEVRHAKLLLLRTITKKLGESTHG
ncbi:hypothetical protein GCM10028816_18710 [Spirosoma lituiforme]